MTRFGWVMATYFSAMATVGVRVRQASAQADLERQREHADRPLRRAADQARCTTPNLSPSCRRSRIASFLADGGYLPRGVPLMKRVLALPGQSVCRHGLRITIDRVEVGDAQARDRRGRDLPDWQGCRTVAAGRGFSDEPRRPRQSGRPVFRPAARQLDRRSGGSSLDR